ncbi:hypothetical protein FJD34_26340 [Pseudomonas brenneri]|uniref:Uncharacterized protein n=1 Tax=Pseudomonas brenneri TaxID=129817 RepID=A0A5B2UI48_9PSED|nr:hypothetical protein F1720_25920 [Pseudomonas brenneri]TWR73671.1 hypothetical protein FJD34_26340 [Pseudomonas brenneri]
MRLSTALFQKIQKPLQGSGWCSGRHLKCHMPCTTLITVGASLLAKNVNDNAFNLIKRVLLRSFASKLAPTKSKKRCSRAAWGLPQA